MLQLGYLESREATHGEQNVRWAEYQRRRQDQAFRQYMTSLNALATLRRLVPQQTVYVPLVQQTAASNSAPEAASAGDHRQERGHVNGHGQKINGHSHVNGHNRISAVLGTPATAGNG